MVRFFADKKQKRSSTCGVSLEANEDELIQRHQIVFVLLVLVVGDLVVDVGQKLVVL